MHETSKGRGSHRPGCQRRCEGAAAGARRGLSAGTTRSAAAPPTADAVPAPGLATPTPLPSAAIPEQKLLPRGPQGRATPTGLRLLPLPRLRRFLGAVDRLPQLWLLPAPRLDHALPCVQSC
ncbi:hypothetical protein H1C71_032890 [Ictidomys tridecemlineatus]|nr:hypothetical protein H1C71_032890 [Ictidomys tridecemlineatus]